MSIARKVAVIAGIIPDQACRATHQETRPKSVTVVEAGTGGGVGVEPGLGTAEVFLQFGRREIEKNQQTFSGGKLHLSSSQISLEWTGR